MFRLHCAPSIRLASALRLLLLIVVLMINIPTSTPVNAAKPIHANALSADVVYGVEQCVGAAPCTNAFMKIDLRTGTKTVVGVVGDESMAFLPGSAIGIDPVTNQFLLQRQRGGTWYLAGIDLDTGIVTEYVALAHSFIQMDIHPTTGAIYGVESCAGSSSCTNAFIKLDRTTGTKTVVGLVGNPSVFFVSRGAVGIDLVTNQFLVQRARGSNWYLAGIDLDTGAVTEYLALTRGFIQMDMHPTTGAVYGVEPCVGAALCTNAFIKIDLRTGTKTVVGIVGDQSMAFLLGEAAGINPVTNQFLLQRQRGGVWYLAGIDLATGAVTEYVTLDHTFLHVGIPPTVPSGPILRPPTLGVAAQVTVVQRVASAATLVAGSSFTLTVVATNRGHGMAEDTTIMLPLDPTQLHVDDATFSRRGAWVSRLTDTVLTLQTGALAAGGDTVTGTIRLTVLNSATAGGTLDDRLTFTWQDAVVGGRGSSNNLALRVGGPAFSPTLNGGTIVDGRITFSSAIFAPSEPVGFWYNTPDNRAVGVATIKANADGTVSMIVDVRNLPSGTYSMVAYGHWTTFTGVVQFVLP